MSIDFTFSDIAQKEVRESFDWYEEKLIGLGIDFLEAIDDALNSISKSPEAYQNRNTKTNTKEFVVKRFPYIIVYRFSKKENTVYILHIFHTSRHPKFKYRKK
jgi:plasmid stabilization system protein ParE